MEVIVKVIFFSNNKIKEEFFAKVNEDNAKKAKGRIEYERNKMIDYLMSLFNQGVIKSVYRPKNKKIQRELNEIIKAKRELKESLEKIKILL